MSMKNLYWTKEIDAEISVCDENGIIVEMNDKSIKAFKEEGGEKLIGTKLIDCHPDSAKKKLAELIASKNPNYYTTEKNGVKHFVYHTPWFENGIYKGYAEMILDIPFEIPHYVRD